MTAALFWLSVKTFFKKLWAWCKKNWKFFVGAAIPIIALILLGRKKEATRLLERVREDHKKEIEAIESAREEERKKLQEANQKYRKTIEDIEKKYKELSKDLDEDKKQRVDELLKESEKDPEVLTKKISEILGFEIYE